MANQPDKGIVYLVGAGPGDPGLITVKGLHCIQTADVLIYDYLAAKTFLNHAGPKCECIYVGKKGGDHTLSQDGINQLIVEKARAGKIVTRLKGGDPFIFGRGGEEAEILVEAGIPFEVVPGVTSAIAGPAYAGIPLTHRQFTSTLAFVTGHEDPTKEASGIDWSALARGIGTLVFFMGVKNLPKIVQRLCDNGRPADTPVAVVRWGTTARHQTVTGTLEDIVEQTRKAEIKAPALIVVGKVVSLRETLQWFEKKPLLGKRIMVTRARAQASDLVHELSAMGADCIECPTIEVVQPDNWAPLDGAIAAIEKYDWLIFTSVNGVQAFFDRLYGKGLDTRALGHLRTACIGPATAQCLLQYGIKTDILPETYQAESVVEAFENEVVQGRKVLLPRAKEARAILPAELKRMGAEVDEIVAYQTIAVTEGCTESLLQLEAGQIDMVTFTSSSTVRNFNALLKERNSGDLMKGITVACIGPITADTAQALGFKVHIIAQDFTISGLTKAISNYYGSH